MASYSPHRPRGRRKTLRLKRQPLPTPICKDLGPPGPHRQLHQVPERRFLSGAPGAQKPGQAGACAQSEHTDGTGREGTGAGRQLHWGLSKA